MSNFERPSLVSQHSHSQKLINEIRAGDSCLTQAAWLLITIWILQQQSAGFQPINPAPMPPHIESARNLLFGKPKPDQRSCRQFSRFDSQQFENNERLISKNSPNYIEKITFFDGYEAETLNSSLDHLLSKHGHTFGIDERLQLNPNQKPTKYPQIRTKINGANRNQYRENLKQFGQNPDLTVFEDVLIRGEPGKAYFCEETQRVIDIATEGLKAGQIIKAQPLGQFQINILCTQNRID